MNATGDPVAIFREGMARLQAGDAAGAAARLEQAARLDAHAAEPALWLATAHRMAGRLDAALQAVDEAIRRDPYFFMAQLTKGSLLAQLAQHRQAARVWRNAIRIAPDPSRLPQPARDELERARAAVRADAEALATHMRAATAPVAAHFAPAELDRARETMDILAGVTRAYVQEPLLLTVPGLPAVPFFDRSLFGWLETLEAATEMIREEFLGVLAQDIARFRPYIQFPEGAPVNQWVALNHSPDWSSLFLWKDGVRDAQTCARCPGTAALLERLPMADHEGFAPTAMFSVLQPRTRIPPHTGSSNARALVHLPLVLPGQCGFRVGNQVREWRMGEAWVFDDTIEHEAWNDSDQMRAILIIDVWNPFLTPADIAMVRAMTTALNEWNAGRGVAG